MKKHLFFVLALLPFLIGCQALSELTKFHLPVTTTVTVPATNVIVPLDIPLPDVQTNSSSFFSANKIDTSLIQKVALEKMELTVTSPEGGNFDFLKSVDIYISADGLPEVKVAGISNVPDGASQPLKMTVVDVDLRKYIVKDKFKLRFSSVTDRTIPQDYKIDVKTSFLIDVKVAGL